MAEAFGHHSNNTIWKPQPRTFKKRYWVLGVVTALIAIVAAAATVAIVTFVR